MALNYKELDERTRNLMLREIELDISNNDLYISDNLNQMGQINYPDLIREAARQGSDITLGEAILNFLNLYEKQRKLKNGSYSRPKMRCNAHEMLAEGEFNRFYIRAICLRAIEDGIAELVVYRAKNVQNPRAESELKVGKSISAKALLDDLRKNTGVDTAFGLPPGPNSGLCVHLP
ncbi:hypothetical protein KKF34_01260 [Myxococcota bacterium]|nr:hypothetical protein [Myxococcota bacterium]MBU1382963.1 hypothetical protein [Myxococcota bacterium]MBU1495489.1 hypothetical protein [Myxococcota bacterium]